MKILFILMSFLLITKSHCQSKTDAQYLLEFNIQGDNFEKMKDFKSAADCYTFALNCTNDKNKIYRKRAIVYFADKDYEKAILDYTILIESGTDNTAEMYFFRGLSKILIGDINGCSDLSISKKMEFEADWDKFKIICNIIN